MRNKLTTETAGTNASLLAQFLKHGMFDPYVSVRFALEAHGSAGDAIMRELFKNILNFQTSGRLTVGTIAYEVK